MYCSIPRQLEPIYYTVVMNVWYEQDNENEHPPAEVDDSVDIIFFNYLHAKKL